MLPSMKHDLSVRGETGLIVKKRNKILLETGMEIIWIG